MLCPNGKLGLAGGRKHDASVSKLEAMRMIVLFSRGWVFWLARAQAPPQPARFPQVRWAARGAVMTVIKVTYRPILPTLVEHALAYLDSG